MAADGVPVHSIWRNELLRQVSEQLAALRGAATGGGPLRWIRAQRTVRLTAAAADSDGDA